MKIVVYTMDYCPYCDRAKSLLQSKGANFTEEKVDIHDREMWKTLEQRSGMKTMPQIYFDDKCVGGFQELNALEQSGELDKLLS